MEIRKFNRSFSVRNNKQSLETREETIGENKIEYVNKLVLPLWAPKDLEFMPELTIMDVSDDTLFIKTHFKGGSSLVDRSKVLNSKRRKVIELDFSNVKKELRKYIEIEFIWEKYSDEKIVTPPETSGKSVLVAL